MKQFSDTINSFKKQFSLNSVLFKHARKFIQNRYRIILAYGNQTTYWEVIITIAAKHLQRQDLNLFVCVFFISLHLTVMMTTLFLPLGTQFMVTL